MQEPQQRPIAAETAQMVLEGATGADGGTVAPRTRVCAKCGEIKSIAEFASPPSYGGYRRRTCRTCCAARGRAWQEANTERHSATRRNRRLRDQYGITQADYEAMYDRQVGRCAICNGWYEALVIDHCHESGEVRALLCSPCNSVLGMAGDDWTILEQAISYLQEFRT